MKELLIGILQDKENRYRLVFEFQEQVFKSEEEHEILDNLAYSLEDYVQNEEHRKEDYSYFGNEKLEELILQALKDLEAAGQ